MFYQVTIRVPPELLELLRTLNPETPDAAIGLRYFLAGLLVTHQDRLDKIIPLIVASSFSVPSMNP